MLQPKRRKYVKEFRGRRHGVATRGSTISFGDIAMKAQEVAWVTSAQIEAARRTITHGLKKGGRVWVRVFPDKPVTFKGAEVGMGGGKGGVDHYVYPIRPGRIIFEIDGLKEDVSREALEGAGDKLPIKTKFIKKDNII